MIINFLFLVIALRFWKALEMSKSCNFSLRKLQYNCTRCINWIMEIGPNKTNCWFLCELYIVLLLDDASHLLSATPPGQTLTSAEQPIFVQHTSGKKMQPIAMTGCASTLSSHKRKKIYILVQPPGTQCWHYPHAVTVPSTKLFNCCLCKLCVL